MEVALPGRDEPVEASGTLAQVSALLFVADAAAGASSASHHRIEASRTESVPADGALSVASLAVLMKVAPAEATRLLRFWERKGVLEGRGDAAGAAFGPATPPRPEADGAADGDTTDGGAAADGSAAAAIAAAASSAGGNDDDDGDEEGEGALASAVRMQQELLVRQFAVGMLRSHGSMPLQRVLSMLRSFSPCEWRLAESHVFEPRVALLGIARAPIPGAL